MKATRIFAKTAQGWHGKGSYTGQGRYVITNNGDSPAIGDLKGMTLESDPKTWTKGPEDSRRIGRVRRQGAADVR
ncbi:MAG: hypothetical protein QM811_13890 [Pirellulales bacterium]